MTPTHQFFYSSLKGISRFIPNMASECIKLAAVLLKLQGCVLAAGTERCVVLLWRMAPKGRGPQGGPFWGLWVSG